MRPSRRHRGLAWKRLGFPLLPFLNCLARLRPDFARPGLRARADTDRRAHTPLWSATKTAHNPPADRFDYGGKHGVVKSHLHSWKTWYSIGFTGHTIICVVLSLGTPLPPDARDDSRAIEYPVMMGFIPSTDILWAVILCVAAFCFFAVRVCLPPSGSCVCARAPRSTPCHAVRVRWQFPCLAVTEECILLQSELAAGCFDAALCYGSGIITLPVIKTKPCDAGPPTPHG